MKKIILIFLAIISLQTYSQDFSSKPITFAQELIIKNVNLENISNELPEDYAIVLKENEKIVAEKNMNGRIYDITFYFQDQKLTGIVSILHSSTFNRLLDEAKELRYKIQDEFYINGVETVMYKNDENMLGLVLSNNEGKREIMCTVYIPKNQNII